MNIISRIASTIVLAASVFAGNAQAQETYGPVEKINIPGIGRVDYQFLFTEISAAGESLDAFALRIGPRLRAFSDETGFEACGVLATDGTRFGVVVGSNHSHIACANFHSKVPEGMSSTNETIHTHGKEKVLTNNRNDRALQGQAFHGQRVLRAVAGQNIREFSNMDYDGGAGYLATPEGVKHQKGAGTTRTLEAHGHAH